MLYKLEDIIFNVLIYQTQQICKLLYWVRVIYMPKLTKANACWSLSQVDLYPVSLSLATGIEAAKCCVNAAKKSTNKFLSIIDVKNSNESNKSLQQYNLKH